MMQKHLNTQSKLTKYLLILPILSMAILFHSCKDQVVEASDLKVDETYQVQSKDTVVSFDPNTNKESFQVVESSKTVYKVVDEMPRFPGCEDLASNERTQCSKKNLLNYIYTKVKYPEAAKIEGAEGTVICQFVVSHDGVVENIDIVKDPGFGMSEEVLRVVTLMAKSERWIPGLHNGKAVNVAFTLPVKFKLS